MDLDNEDKEIIALMEEFCRVSGEDPSKYDVGFGMLTKKSILNNRDDSLFTKIWRHVIPMFEAMPQLEKIAIIDSNLEYSYFVLPEDLSEHDLDMCVQIYNSCFANESIFSNYEPIDVRGIFNNFLLDRFEAHFDK